MERSKDIIEHHDFLISSKKPDSSLLKKLWQLYKKNPLTGRSGPKSPRKSESIRNKLITIDPIIKRGRGRPKKLFKDLEAVPKPKRPVGRPRKRPLDSNETERDSNSPKKRAGVNNEEAKNTYLKLKNDTDQEECFIRPTCSFQSKILKNTPIPSPLKQEIGYVTASTSPIKQLLDSPRKKLFTSPIKSQQQHEPCYNLKLNNSFKPTPIPKENDYNPPNDRSLAYFFDGFEGYIDQKKPIRAHKKSRNSMTMAPSITKEEFTTISKTLNTIFHKSSRICLKKYQTELFPQYCFEVTQGFSLLFYGIGSKRKFLEDFVLNYLSPKLYLQQYECNNNELEIEGIPCIIINGYNPSCNYRDIFQSISNVMLSEELAKSETKYWNNHVSLQTNRMIEHYKDMPWEIKLIILVHNLDGPALRKDPFQNMLSSLALIKQISIVTSVDHIQSPLLWDSSRSQNFNFVYHDITNFESYTIESSFRDIMKFSKESTNMGSNGVKYVLESLTNNSKRMFKLLLQNVMSNMKHQQNINLTDSRRANITYGVHFSDFFQMCTNEFIASNEIFLRSMLREFIEHRMVQISKDKSGNEIVYVTYSYGEIQKLSNEILDEV